MSEARQYGRTMLHMVATAPLFGLAHPAFTFTSLIVGSVYFFVSIVVIHDPSPVSMLMAMGVLQTAGIMLTKIDPDLPTLWIAQIRIFRSFAKVACYAG